MHRFAVKRILHLGLTPREGCTHYPVIRIVACEPHLDLSGITHIILTSKTAARLFFSSGADYTGRSFIAVGKATAKEITPYARPLVAETETSEGVVELLRSLDVVDPFFFWPHSQGSRRVIPDFFSQEGVRFRECILYRTVNQIPRPIPDLAAFDEVAFTSPSTVDGFFQIYKKVPEHIHLSPIGPVTAEYLQRCLSNSAK